MCVCVYVCVIQYVCVCFNEGNMLLNPHQYLHLEPFSSDAASNSGQMFCGMCSPDHSGSRRRASVIRVGKRFIPGSFLIMASVLCSSKSHKRRKSAYILVLVPIKQPLHQSFENCRWNDRIQHVSVLSYFSNIFKSLPYVEISTSKSVECRGLSLR